MGIAVADVKPRVTAPVLRVPGTRSPTVANAMATPELACTSPTGFVIVSFPVVADRTVAVVKDIVHACPVPWPRIPFRTGLDTQFVQGVLAYAALVSDEVSIFNPDGPLCAADPPTVRPLHVTVTRPDGKAVPVRVIVMALRL